MICPNQLRALGVELIQQTRENAYKSHQNHRNLSDRERAALYDKLKEKIRNEGFRPELPITVALLRKYNKKDKILQGHDRLSIAIELGLQLVPVRFVH